MTPRRPPPWACALAALVGTAAAGPRSAAADEGDPLLFTRIDPTAGYGPGNFSFAYSVEAARSFAVYARQAGGGGGGGDGDGQNAYVGVMHRFDLGVGITPWLTLAAEQSLRQLDSQTFEVGVLQPELRLRLNGLGARFARLPVEISPFVGSQVRLNAQRDSSIIIGLGVEKRLSRFFIAGRAAFETTLADTGRENGMRYELGLGLDPHRLLRLALEAWGVLVWPEEGVFRTQFHAGPSLQLRLPHVRVSVTYVTGVREQPHKTFVDGTGMGRVALVW